MTPWIDLEEIAYHDVDPRRELYDTYPAFDNKVRSFKNRECSCRVAAISIRKDKPQEKARSPRRPWYGNGGVLWKGFWWTHRFAQFHNPVDRSGFSGCFISDSMPMLTETAQKEAPLNTTYSTPPLGRETENMVMMFE